MVLSDLKGHDACSTVQARLVPGVHKIAVLRANAIGDYIFTIPALEALKRAYPKAELVLLGLAWHAAFLAGRPGPIDRVEIVPPTRGVGEAEDAPEDPQVQDEFFGRMAEERFDLALQFHGGGRYSNPFVRRLGARVTAGLKTPDAAPLDRWVRYVYWQGEVVRYLEVVRLVGATPSVIAPRVAVTDADLAESCRVVPVDSRPLAALNPGASDPERRWPAEKFAVVGDALTEIGARVVVTGAGFDGSLAATIQRAMRCPSEDTTGRLSLGGLAGLLARCTLVVSNDTGPLHLAAAVGTASVGIYWCFNLINAGPVETARQRPIVSWRISCPVCGVDRAAVRCDHHPSFLADVPTDTVVKAALDVFRLETVDPSEAAQDRRAVGSGTHIDTR
ncbi:MAG: hypothetical protein QOF01_2854 [Thermomicrobiales bacterium]|jgi:ADP-heptose:LPS heptosyltransferase|nr:hypothetical protein [Thermomicrobiales bacterium]